MAIAGALHRRQGTVVYKKATEARAKRRAERMQAARD
eukprot:gene1060-8341_t